MNLNGFQLDVRPRRWGVFSYLNVGRDADLRRRQGHGRTLLGAFAHADPGPSQQPLSALLLDRASGGCDRQRPHLSTFGSKK